MCGRYYKWPRRPGTSKERLTAHAPPVGARGSLAWFDASSGSSSPPGRQQRGTKRRQRDATESPSGGARATKAARTGPGAGSRAAAAASASPSHARDIQRHAQQQQQQQRHARAQAQARAQMQQFMTMGHMPTMGMAGPAHGAGRKRAMSIDTGLSAFQPLYTGAAARSPHQGFDPTDPMAFTRQQQQALYLHARNAQLASSPLAYAAITRPQSFARPLQQFNHGIPMQFGSPTGSASSGSGAGTQSSSGLRASAGGSPLSPMVASIGGALPATGSLHGSLLSPSRASAAASGGVTLSRANVVAARVSTVDAPSGAMTAAVAVASTTSAPRVAHASPGGGRMGITARSSPTTRTQGRSPHASPTQHRKSPARGHPSLARALTGMLPPGAVSSSSSSSGGAFGVPPPSSSAVTSPSAASAGASSHPPSPSTVFPQRIGQPQRRRWTFGDALDFEDMWIDSIEWGSGGAAGADTATLQPGPLTTSHTAAGAGAATAAQETAGVGDGLASLTGRPPSAVSSTSLAGDTGATNGGGASAAGGGRGAGAAQPAASPPRAVRGGGETGAATEALGTPGAGDVTVTIATGQDGEEAATPAGGGGGGGRRRSTSISI